MELKTFIAQSLSGIANGVQEASKSSGHLFMLNRARGNDTSYIDFDVAVTSSDESGAKAGIFVLNVGAQAALKTRNEDHSRIKFRVCYRGPEHEQL